MINNNISDVNSIIHSDKTIKKLRGSLANGSVVVGCKRVKLVEDSMLFQKVTSIHLLVSREIHYLPVQKMKTSGNGACHVARIQGFFDESPDPLFLGSYSLNHRQHVDQTVVLLAKFLNERLPPALINWNFVNKLLLNHPLHDEQSWNVQILCHKSVVKKVLKVDLNWKDLEYQNEKVVEVVGLDRGLFEQFIDDWYDVVPDLDLQVFVKRRQDAKTGTHHDSSFQQLEGKFINILLLVFYFKHVVAEFDKVVEGPQDLAVEHVVDILFVHIYCVSQLFVKQIDYLFMGVPNQYVLTKIFMIMAKRSDNADALLIELLYFQIINSELQNPMRVEPSEQSCYFFELFVQNQRDQAEGLFYKYFLVDKLCQYFDQAFTKHILKLNLSVRAINSRLNFFESLLNMLICMKVVNRKLYLLGSLQKLESDLSKELLSF